MYARRAALYSAVQAVMPIFQRNYDLATLGDEADWRRATKATVVDFEGLVRECKIAEARFTNARKVENLLAGPTGTLATETVTVVSGHEYRLSFEGDGSITLSGAATGTLAGTAGQRKVFDVFVASGTSLTVTVAGTITDALLEDVTGQANQNPSEYVSAGVGTVDVSDSFVFDQIGDGWTDNGDGSYTCDGTQTGSSSIRAWVPVRLRRILESELTISGYGGGQVRFYSLGGFTSPWYSGNGTYKYLPTVNCNDNYQIQADPDFVGTISDIVIKTLDHGANVDGVRYFTTTNGNTVDGNNVVTEAPGTPLTGDIELLMEALATNYADCADDLSGGAETVDLTAGGTGDYTLWVEGTAAVTVAAGTATGTGFGQATQGNPVVFNLTGAGTVTLTLNSGTLDKTPGGAAVKQVEKGDVPTSLVITSGGAVTRNTEELFYPLTTPQSEGMLITRGTPVHANSTVAGNAGIATFQKANIGAQYLQAINSRFTAYDGVNAVGVDHPYQGGEEKIVATWWGGGQMNIGVKDVNTDTWEWGTPVNYVGAWPTTNELYLLSGLRRPVGMDSVEVFDVNAGQQWIEDNY